MKIKNPYQEHPFDEAMNKAIVKIFTCIIMILFTGAAMLPFVVIWLNSIMQVSN